MGEGLSALGGSEKYSFFYFKANHPNDFRVDLNSVVLCPLVTRGALRVNDLTLRLGQTFIGRGDFFSLGCDGETEFLLGGVKGSFPRKNAVFDEGEVKRVQKPWGYELWYNSEDEDFAFKKIFVKAKNRLSLQYHREKRETQFLHKGAANLHYYKREFFEDKNIDEKAVAQEALSAPLCIDIPPRTVHRIEAITDTTVFEISTPELDDVVRLQDDQGRPDGRISFEH